MIPVLLLVALGLSPGAALAQDAPEAPVQDRLIVLHTNDWQSRLLPFGPNADYTEAPGDDATLGGIARMQTLVERERARAQEAGVPLLLLDGGDITAGTLFHSISRETGTELQLMARLGYDAVTLGNHDFDFGPQGLVEMIESARRGVGTPPIVASNLAFDPEDPADDALEAAFAEEGSGLYTRLLLEKGDLKIGLLGVLGVGAHEVASDIEPVGIRPPVETIRAAAQALRRDGAQVVLLLSHSGVERQEDGSWGGEEVGYLEEIGELDAVIGGHSHTALREPVLVGHRPVVQAGSDGRFVGRLELARNSGGGFSVASYTLLPVDDALPADLEVAAHIAVAKQEVDARILQPQGYSFDQALARVDRHLSRDFDDHVLGNLVTDALREATGAHVSVTGNGTLRADLWPGVSGVQRVSDVFRVTSLGMGVADDSPGFPLMVAWYTGAELKAAFEVLLMAYTVKGDSYYPRISGAQVEWSPYRAPFDRIHTVRLGNDIDGYEEISTDPDDPTLYAMGTTTYIGGFIGVVEELSYGLHRVTPKTATGAPLTRPEDGLVDADPETPGVQELKAWRAWMDHLQRQPDADGDGLPDVVSTGPAAAERLIRTPEPTPAHLLGGATWIQWTLVALLLGLPALVLGLPLLLLRRRRARAQGATP